MLYFYLYLINKREIESAEIDIKYQDEKFFPKIILIMNGRSKIIEILQSRICFKINTIITFFIFLKRMPMNRASKDPKIVNKRKEYLSMYITLY